MKTIEVRCRDCNAWLGNINRKFEDVHREWYVEHQSSELVSTDTPKVALVCLVGGHMGCKTKQINKDGGKHRLCNRCGNFEESCEGREVKDKWYCEECIFEMEETGEIKE